MNNNLFLRNMMSGTSLYNHCTGPNVFNQQTGRSEDCSPQTPGASWSLVVSLKQDELERLVGADRKSGLLGKHHATNAAVDSRMGEFNGIHSLRDLDDGTVQITLRKKCMTAKGKENAPPAIVDTQRKPVENRDFASGSLINVMVAWFPTKSPASGLWGMSGIIDAIQLVEPVWTTGGVSDFPDLSGSTDPVANAFDDFNDEIPFG